MAAEQTLASSSTADLSATGRRLNKWFNLELEDVDGVKAEVRFWRNAVVRSFASLPQQPMPPMYIEVCLDISRLPSNGELQVADVFGRPWTVDLEMSRPDSSTGPSPSASRDGGYRRKRATAIVLEVWRVDLATHQVPAPAPDLPRVYKQAIVFFRALYSFANLLPCATLIRNLRTSDGCLGLFCSLRPDLSPREGTIDLDTSFTGTEHFLESHKFEPIATPMGSFVIDVQYRRECAFSANPPPNAHTLDSIAGMGAIDEAYFTPTLSSQSGSSLSLPRHLQQQPPLLPQHRHGQANAASPPASKRRSTFSTAPLRGTPISNKDASPHTRRSRFSTHQHSLPDGQQQQHHHHHHHLRESLLSSERSLGTPSVNPFRAHPLSLGDSSSLPSYLDDTFVRATASGPSSELHLASDSGKMTSSKISLRRISFGARNHASGNEDANADSSASGLSSSGGGGGADAGSVLHRGVMQRRLGSSLSPNDSHRHLDSPGNASNTDAPGSGSKSPPRTGPMAILSTTSGSLGSSAGRSVLGFVSPFKSRSLVEAQAGIAGRPMDVDSLPSSQKRSHDANRLHSTAASYEAPIHSALHSAAQQQFVARVSESPSSLGSNVSGYNRGLSSSFGNRRGSASRRRSSILAMSPVNSGPETLGVPPYNPSLSRRHTIVEGKQWSDVQPGSSSQENSGQNIEDFIRMVDSRRPLKMFSSKDSRSKARGNSPGNAFEIMKNQQQQQQLVSVKSAIREAGTPTADLPHSLPARGKGMRGYHGNAPSSVSPRNSSLTRYQGILHEFNGLSQDMQNSVLLQQQQQHSLSAGIDAVIADQGSISSSPFRRPAIPNPLKSAERAASSRPSSILS
ncbi:autophagy protein 13, partial [Dipsacomyces acuminosporus]